MKRIILTGLILALVGCSDDKLKTPKPVDVKASQISESAPKATEQQKPVDEKPMVVKIDDLAKDYKANEIAGDQKYINKTILTKGVISSIDSGIGNEAVVHLKTKDMFNTVMAKGDENFTKDAAKLKRGQQVTLLCVGDGVILGSPSLGDCVINPPIK